MKEKGIGAAALTAVVIVAVVVGAGLGYYVLSGILGGGLPSGTATMGTEGFDFSAGAVAGYPDEDFFIEPWYGCYGGSGVTPAILGYTGVMENSVQDMGARGLASVTTAPETGYSDDVLAVEGHVYVIKCRENTYGKIRFTSISFTGGDYPATFVFDWVYQPNGSRNF